MALKKLSKEKVGEALAELSKFRLIAPAKSDDVVVFKQISDPAEAYLEYGNSTVPPKKFAFPQTETLFRFVTGSPDLTAKNVEEEGTTVIFGLRPCDARAMAIVDKLFSWDFDDPYYLKRRELTTLVGMACVEPPSVNCCCTSLGGSPFGTEGLDLLLTDMGDYYLVEALTDKGEKLEETLSSQLEDAPADDEKKAKDMAAASEGKIRRSINTEGIPEKLPDLWPNGGEIYRSWRGIKTGEMAGIDLDIGPKTISTGVVVDDVTPTSFTLQSPAGHLFAGRITFSTRIEAGKTVASIEIPVSYPHLPLPPSHPV